MRKITFDELLLYRHCPARWVWQEGYKVVPVLSVAELYHTTMKRIFQWILDSFLAIPPSKTQVIEKWTAAWQAVAVAASVPSDEILLRERRGHGILLNYYDDFARHPPVNVHLPWSWKLPDLGVELVGEIPAITERKNDAYSYWMVDAIPPYPGMGASSTDMSLYLLPLRAFRRHTRQTIDFKDTSIAVLDFERGGLKKIDPGGDPVPLVGIALEQMTKYLCLPHTGPWCPACPFTASCHSHNLYPSRVKPLGFLPGAPDE